MRKCSQFHSLLVSLLASAAIVPCDAEFRHFEGPIEAASNFIHYSEGYIVTPGYVDISNLVFETADNGKPTKIFEGKERDKDDGEDFVDDVIVEGEGDAEGDDEGGRQRFLNEDIGGESTYVDIVLFHEPPDCANTRLGCDWPDLGVGASDGTGNLRWCCVGDAKSLELCDGGPQQEGRLIIDPAKFKGQHRFLSVPRSGNWKSSVESGTLNLKSGVEQSEEGAGKYILVVTNCNDINGRDLLVTGEYTMKSVHGYLPGNLFKEMYFYAIVTICYLLIFTWYGLKMSIHRDEIIQVQQWMMGTIFIGLLEVFFKMGDLWVWNVDGNRFWFTLYTSILAGVLKRAISRCLVLMLCLGWGVTCADLGEKIGKIVTLGVIYAVSSAARDMLYVFTVTENEVLTTTTENEIMDVMDIILLITSFIDVLFYWWIFNAISGTMAFLEGMNQSRKLKRYLRLRLYLLLSVLFVVVWTVFSIVDRLNEVRIVNEEENGWVLEAVWEINYLVLLFASALLWVPEAGAKEYAYVMELSAIGDDLEFDTNIGSPENDNEGASDSNVFSDTKPELAGELS